MLGYMAATPWVLCMGIKRQQNHLIWGIWICRDKHLVYVVLSLFLSTSSLVGSCSRSSQVYATFNELSKKKDHERALQIKYSPQRWNMCKLIPAHLAIPTSTELASVSIWQERRPGHGTVKPVSFLNIFTSEISPHSTSHHISPGSRDTWTGTIKSIQNVHATKMNMHFFLSVYWLNMKPDFRENKWRKSMLSWKEILNFTTYKAHLGSLSQFPHYWIWLGSWSSWTGCAQALTWCQIRRPGIFSTTAVTPHHGCNWNPPSHIPNDFDLVSQLNYFLYTKFALCYLSHHKINSFLPVTMLWPIQQGIFTSKSEKNNLKDS